jgi:hypothetical protein
MQTIENRWRRPGSAYPSSRRQVLIIWLCGLITITVAQPSDWETLNEDKNLLIQRRPYAGSALNEIRGVTRIQASLSAAVALLRDARFNPQWVYRSGGATVLQENGDSSAYVYGVVDAPWPIQDRDTVVRFDYQQDPASKTITISIRNFPEFIPDKKEFVRVPDFGGYWKLEPEKGGYIKVTYQVYGDPGGNLPDWLANQAAALSVKNTLLNMQDAVARYAGIRLPFVSEREQ